jgi:hypothetical protein
MLKDAKAILYIKSNPAFRLEMQSIWMLPLTQPIALPDLRWGALVEQD